MPEINSNLKFFEKIFFAKVKCCLARISVGAITATWNPALTLLYAASNDTIVFPLPTSPCKSLNIFLDELKSLLISFNDLIWSVVR